MVNSPVAPCDLYVHMHTYDNLFLEDMSLSKLNYLPEVCVCQAETSQPRGD